MTGLTCTFSSPDGQTVLRVVWQTPPAFEALVGVSLPNLTRRLAKAAASFLGFCHQPTPNFRRSECALMEFSDVQKVFAPRSTGGGHEHRR